MLLQFQNFTVAAGATVPIGDLALPKWFSETYGTVFFDTNENGKRDTGELPLKGQPVVLKARENSVVDQGSRAVVTDANGKYILEAGLTRTATGTCSRSTTTGFFTTGVTFQTDNQDTETTVLGAGVDVFDAELRRPERPGRLGRQAYAPGTNGGIVGTSSTTRPATSSMPGWPPRGLRARYPQRHRQTSTARSTRTLTASMTPTPTAR